MTPREVFTGLGLIVVTSVMPLVGAVGLALFVCIMVPVLLWRTLRRCR